MDAGDAARAPLGAQTVALQQQATNVNPADLTAATALAADQIESCISTAILANTTSQASLVESS